MSAAVCEKKEQALVPPILAGVKAAVETTFTAIFGEKPQLRPEGDGVTAGPCIAGIISFLCEMPWSLAWVLPPETAPAVVRGCMGFEFPFDSPDMPEAVAELVNILAGDVVAQLESRRVKSQMGLPTVARGTSLELVPLKASKVICLSYSSKAGPFWLRVTYPA